MGFAPQLVDTMFLWQFNAAFSGWREANGMKPSGAGEMSEAELAELGIEGFL